MAGEENQGDHIVTNRELIWQAEGGAPKGRVISPIGELDEPALVVYDHDLALKRARSAMARVLAEEGVGADLDTARSNLKQNLGATLAALSFIGMLES